MALRKTLTAVALTVALASAPSVVFAQSQVIQQTGSGAAAGQSEAAGGAAGGVTAGAIAAGVAVAAAVAVAVSAITSDDDSTTSTFTATSTVDPCPSSTCGSADGIGAVSANVQTE
jgi:hypothetical protein